MKITILALHLGYGGIEKFISNIANMLAKKNEVEIISIYKLYDKPPFYIDSNVKIVYLLDKYKPNRDKVFESIKKLNMLELIKQSCIAIKILFLKKYRMKNEIKKINSDIVISTIPAHNKLVSKYCSNSIKKIATEHNYKNNKYINKVVSSCKNLDYIVIASKKLSDIYKKKMIKQKCKVINIPLQIDYLPEKNSNCTSKNITYVGRLSPEKGVIDLIEVFNKVHEIDSDFKLNIIGDGVLKNELQNKIDNYNLKDSVTLYGFLEKNKIEKILLNTSIGINTSYTESFGLSILETFGYGVPCICFSTAEGASEIIDDGINGFIVEGRDIKKMANQIVDLVNNREKLKQFGNEARKKSMKFNSNEIEKKWIALLNKK